jgi:2,4-dienoyl-CoA reductase-like NADH-dependent reductase (Old Yellow Enzyme family)
MTDSEVWAIADAFAEAAWRARAAGFDALELHAAHGGLLAAFLSPYLNRREDYWGGDEERRSHFLEEVCRAVREAVGRSFPVLVKLNAREDVEGGMDPVSCARVAAGLAHMGIDGVEISGGFTEHVPPPDISSPEGEAPFREGARLVKKEAAVPVILTGGLRSLAVMEDVLAAGDADLLGLGRPLLRQPDLPRLLAGGAAGADCLSCNRCTRLHKLRHVRCKQVREDAAAG